MMWFYRDGDQEIGPISKEKMQSLIHAKIITGQTMIRNEQTDQWRLLAEMMRAKVPGSVPPTGGSHPPPAAEINTPIAAEISSRENKTPFQFKGAGGEYFKIWIVNVLLSIVTLGIYSAWAKVRRKQYFYGNTYVADSAFRYLADPVKIFKGRMLVVLIFIIYSIINEVLPVVGALLSVGVFFLLPWIVVRSLMFNARNSSLRNIRFNFKGTYAEAAKAYILYPLLAAVTLGILSPYAYFKQKKFMVENSAYGTTLFQFNATTKDYYRIVFSFIIPTLIFIGLGVVAALLLPVLTVVVVMIFYLYALAFYSVKSSNLLYNSLVLADHGFQADMSVKEYALITFTNTMATVLTLGFFYPFAQVRSAKYKIEHLTFLVGGDLDQFVAGELAETNALGDEISDFMDFDFGF